MRLSVLQVERVPALPVPLVEIVSGILIDLPSHSGLDRPFSIAIPANALNLLEAAERFGSAFRRLAHHQKTVDQCRCTELILRECSCISLFRLCSVRKGLH